MCFNYVDNFLSSSLISRQLEDLSYGAVTDAVKVRYNGGL